MKHLLTVCLSVLLVLAMTLALSGCISANTDTTTAPGGTTNAPGGTTTSGVPGCQEHIFNGFVCVNCAAPKGISGEHITALLESLESEGYTLDFSGLTSKQYEGGKLWDTQTISVGKLSALVKDGKLLFSMVFSSEEEDQNVTFYGDGEYIYLSTGSMNGYDVYSYEEILGEVGAGTEDIPETEEELKELLVSLIGQENLDQWTQVLENGQTGYLEWAAELFGNCFRVEADGKTFTLDMAALRQFNENAYTLTIPGLFDACYGEGNFSKLQGQLIDLGDMTLAKAIRELFAMAAERGISENMLVSTINAILAATGEEVDFGEMLDSSEFRTTTVADFVSSMMSEDGEPQPDFKWDELVAGYFGAVVDVKLYDLLCAEDPEDAEYLYTFINELCSQEKLAVQLVLSPEGKLESAKITLNELVLPEDETSEIHFSGTISFALEGEISAEGPALKEKLEGWKQAVLDGLKVGIENSENGTLVYEKYGDIFNFSLNDDGSIRLEVLSSWPEDSGLYEDISQLLISAAPDCTDVYYFSIGHYIIYDYLNVKTGEILEYSAHDWQEYIPNDLPAGTPTSPDGLSCGQEYYESRKCSLCGLIDGRMQKVNHDVDYRYVLAEGSVTCKDGAYEETYCLICGEVLDTYLATWHEQNVIRVDNIPAAYGVLTVSVYACPCGYDTGIEIFCDYEDENCCNIYMYYPDDYEEDPDTGKTHWYYYCQTHTDCGFYMVRSTNAVDSGDTCLEVYEEEYRFCLLDNQVGDVFAITVNTYYHDYESYIPDVIPEGVPEDAVFDKDAVACGEVWYAFYRCTRCADSYQGFETKYHEYENIYELAEGAVTCEDGVVERYACTNCGDVSYEETYYWHMNERKEDIVLDTPHGELIAEVYGCPCGAYEDIDFTETETGCYLSYDNIEFEDLYDGQGNYVGYRTVMRCSLTHDGEACSFYVVYMEEGESGYYAFYQDVDGEPVQIGERFYPKYAS